MANHDLEQALFLGLANWVTGRDLETRQTAEFSLLDETALLELSSAGDRAMERLQRLIRNQPDEDHEQLLISD